MFNSNFTCPPELLHFEKHYIYSNVQKSWTIPDIFIFCKENRKQMQWNTHGNTVYEDKSLYDPKKLENQYFILQHTAWTLLAKLSCYFFK